MTKNFEMLLHYKFKKEHNEILENIKKIEKNIENKNYDNSIFLNGRTILEIMLHNIFKTNEKDGLSMQINEACQKYEVPSKVKNAFYFIKQKGDESSHRIKNVDKPYIIEYDLFISIELLKNLFIALKFCLIMDNSFENMKDEENLKNNFNFNSNIYLSKKIFKNQEDKNFYIDKNDMDSQTKGLFQLLTTNYKFFIPTYQREYSWNKENIEVFLQDIKDRNIDKRKHYMGSLAISVDNNNKIIRLIDGQQRITTTLILIKAIINIYKKRDLKLPIELEKISNKINEIYVNKTSIGEFNYISKILSNNMEKSKNFKESIAKKNYDIIYNFFNNKKANIIGELLTTFVHYFIISELNIKNNIENEIQIFENLNSKGLELSQWDLVKNYIYKKIDLKILIKNEAEIEKLFLNLFIKPAAIKFGKYKFERLNEFLKFYSRIKYKIQTNDVLNDKGKIHKIFAKVWHNENKKISSFKEIKESLTEIFKYFMIFCDLKNEDYLESKNDLFEVRVYLKNLQKKPSIMPLIMNMIYENSFWHLDKVFEIEKNLKKILEYIISIEKYITRLLVVSNIGQSLSLFLDSFISKDINKSYENFKEKIKKPGLTTTLPTYESFELELENKDNWQKEYAFNVLRILEFKNTNKTSGRYEVVIKPILENIFPKEKDSNPFWRNINKKLSDENYENIKNSKVNKLGNYIILDSKLKFKTKNKDFEEKLEEYRKDFKNIFIKGLEDNILMNLFDKKMFNFKDIDKRTLQLAGLIAPLYKFGWEK